MGFLLRWEAKNDSAYQSHRLGTSNNPVVPADCLAFSPSTWMWLAFSRMARDHWQVRTSLSQHCRHPISRCSRTNSVPAPLAPANSDSWCCAAVNRTADGSVGRALSVLMFRENRTELPSIDWSECDWPVWNGEWSLSHANNLYQAVHHVK